jgi:DNA replication protein DnaC
MSGPTEVDQLLARAAAIAAASPRAGEPSGRPLPPAVDRVQATVPRRFHAALLDEFDARLADPLREWASADPRGRSSVVMLGPAGSGKSRLAAAVCRRVLDRSSDRVRWWTEADLLDACRPGGAGEGDARTVEVLVIDDLGASAPTEWGVAQLLAIVDARWRDVLPTIATTNCASRVDLADRIGERTVSRLAGGALTLRLSGADRRYERQEGAR